MLSTQQIDAIHDLQMVCEQEESIRLKLNWDMLASPTEEITTFLHYEQEELAGFIGLYIFGNNVELCGMVKPNYRKRGIFTSMFQKAQAFIEERNFSQVLLNTPSSSMSAKAFLHHVGCDYAFSELQMKWVETELGEAEGITLRQALPNDFDIEVLLDVHCFGFSVEAAIDYNQRIKQENTQIFYIIEKNKQPVGKIRINHHNNEAWIYGFAVFPEYQGRGIGRNALKAIIQIWRTYSLFLEVEMTNEGALELYSSCGFRIIQSQDYYCYY